MSSSSQFTRLSILNNDCIFVGQALTSVIAKEVVSNVKASAYIIVTDTNIAPFHLAPLEAALRDAVAQYHPSPASSKVLTMTLPPGEASKTRAMKESIEDWMLERKCTRDSCLLALGGGVIGDMIGYVAATYMRGIPFVQIPTTLLAMVDSSLGGKTAIDTPAGKNLIGAFHQPKRIFIDIDYLRTLPHREFVNGLAEVIKTAAIFVHEDFELLENHPEEILALSKSTAENVDSSLLLKVILGSVRVKAHVVTVDEKETGLRGILNFGHTIGHAIEAILFPELLHGECVAIGMVKEAEIARHLGHLNNVSVGRILRCLQAYGLPVSLEDKLVVSRAPHKHCPVDQLMDIMKVDKKNQGDKKRMVLLSSIGKTLEEGASFVDDHVIRKIIAPAAEIVPPAAFKPSVSLAVPGSKSISNRALVMAALGEGECRLRGLLHSDDVQVMLDALQKLVGISFIWEDDGETLVIQGGGGRLRVPDNEVYLGNAGTASRFLTSVCALIPQPSETAAATIVTGNARMKQRPIGPLVDALRENSCEIEYVEQAGSLPLRIKPTGGLRGGEIRLSASISSQYVSSILISAPYALEPVTLVLTGDAVVSQPYIDMTIEMMASFGIHVKRVGTENRYEIPRGIYQNPSTYLVEADASSSTYPLAFAAITGSTVTVTNIGSKSLQGDAEFAIKVLKPMGCEVSQTETTTTVHGPARLSALPSIDMETMTDAFLTASVLAAVANGKEATSNGSLVTSISGIANQRVKECNRIAAMIEQLAKFGVHAKELQDGLEIHAIDKSQLKQPNEGVFCYDDHRIAMSFSVLGCVMPRGSEVTIKEKKCVEKTWPSWWDTLENVLGVKTSGIDAHATAAEKRGAGAKVTGSGSKGGKSSSAASSAPAATASAAAAAAADKLTSDTAVDSKTLIVIGMRGAGKTHIGQAVAKAFSRQFIDMDAYLESELGTTIPKLIETKGWDEFRNEEARLLVQVLQLYPEHYVVACGGGVVEREENRQVLKAWAAKGGHVVHVQRNLDDLVEYLSIDKTRPAFTNEIPAVWQKRKPWYRECSTVEFVNVKSDGDQVLSSAYWKAVEQDMIRVLRFKLGKLASKSGSELPGSVPAASETSFFLSLTFPTIKECVPILNSISEGVDALELRVDLLASVDVDSVAREVALLRRHSTLPIIFTVRTQSQGGKYDDGNVEGMFELIQMAVKWGVEYIDIEIGGFAEHPKRKQLTEAIIQAKGNAKIIASYHDVAGTVKWNENAIGASTMRDQYVLLYRYGDIVKLIGRASTVEDNFALHRFVNQVVPKLGLGPAKPVIALNMGLAGQLSRALNRFFSPVTHPLLPNSAAPGQLSVAQIHQVRQILGWIQPKNFYLFGEPIKQSMSPVLHNTGFRTLGLPHNYQLFESSDWSKVQALIREQGSSFGGASVTIPLKEDVIAHNVVDSLSPSAEAIGAVNTIIPSIDGTLVGDNTDWIGIRNTILQRVSGHDAAGAIGVVIGAGGTARAACYALKQLGVSELYIWNRTTSRAEELAKAFEARVVVEFDRVFEAAVGGNKALLVISTVPASAQESIASTAVETVFGSTAALAQPKALVEMAYRPRVTRFVQAARAVAGWAVVEGVDVLIAQGLEQFRLWTGRKAPAHAMESEVYANY
ncbi:EPSP synthase-domain-containing protein [Polychytrium aggregatum]|uniref:EPSP synthase-domain-containing protein n=1 Tax=Polychytrium aggregatum TaxID=110093 RepID=UPI0022FE0101|nr:EPSP synthase-domain-containing protein [Polychytrium aggregatum]KAI9203014.1 EPSP synthase-domain-containing protein [Polychytrium aggregatum]